MIYNIPVGKITCLKDYVDVLTNLIRIAGLNNATNQLWYRGQSNCEWDITPQIYRNHNLNHFEREMIRDFKLMAFDLMEKKPEKEVDYLFLMQHYGLPTRLLDWSESYLVALFFAIFDYQNKNDAIVWILNPWSLNNSTIQKYSIPTSSNPLIADYCLDEPHTLSRKVKAKLPMAIRPVRNSSRIIAQKGTFTIHGHDNLPLNKIIEAENSKSENAEIFLYSLKIDSSSKLSILKELQFAGISYSVIFPEIQGICIDLKMKYSEDFTYKAHMSSFD